MAFGSGQGESLVLGFESSFKTPPATKNVDKVAVINPRFRPTVNWHKSAALTGVPEPREPHAGKVGVEANFELECSKDSLPVCLKGLFGAPDTVGTTGYFDHYFTFKAAHPSMFVEEQHTDINQFLFYKGIYLGSGDFSIDPEGLMKATFAGMGAVMSPPSGTTAINGTTNDRTGASPINYLPGVIKQGGVAIGHFQGGTIKVDRGLDKRAHVDGTNEIGVIFPQIPTVTGTLKASFKDAALLTLALNSTETTLEFQLYDGTGHGITFIIPSVKLKPAGTTTNGTGLNDLEFEWESYGRTGATATKAEVWSKYFTSEAGLNTLTLIFALTGAGAPLDQTVIFETGDDTPTEVAAEINAETTDMTASVENGRVVVRPDNPAHTIQITAPSTADVILGFDNAVHSPYSGKSIIVRVSNAMSAVLA